MNYPLIDFDAHYYEPDDCYTRHIEAKYKNLTVRADRSGADGLGRMLIGNERLCFTSVIQNDFVGAPGMMKAFLKGDTEEGGAVNLNALCPRDYPVMMQKKARLQLMDEQNVQAAVLLPTLGVTVQQHLTRHPELEYPTLRSFNRWVQEDWGYGADGRIFGAACLSLNNLEEACKELERLIIEGVRVVHIPCGPIRDRSPADPYFDPFWARMQEAGVLLAYHIGESCFNEMYAARWGEPANPPIHRFSALNMFWGIGSRTITDQVAAMICHDLFGRFPRLQVAIIEFGSSWVSETIKNLDKIYRMADHKTKWTFGKPAHKPSEIFCRHFSVVPFFEENIKELVDLIGDKQVINGSDYPHPEGMKSPIEMLDELTQLPESVVKNIMHNNGARLLRLS
jgi:predicted TIM-barrel fold metal-dependent hydrolase